MIKPNPISNLSCIKLIVGFILSTKSLTNFKSVFYSLTLLLKTRN